jgi:diamine N-acetyltransferase
MMDGIKIKRISKSEISIIKPLWEKLNDIHHRDSLYFKDHYASFTFEKRTEKFGEISDNDILIEIATAKNGHIIGYCVSTISADRDGEIDSIFIEDECRGKGIGEKLIRDAIDFLKNNNCGQILLAVANGRESVFPFYQNLGFFPRLTYLKLKE